MKKFVLILFVTIVALSSCKKDKGGADVTITSSDLATLNGQLKGSWVFPLATLSVFDSSGKPVFPPLAQPSTAFDFDGSSNVDIKPDPQTVQHGTYTLSTKNGEIFVHVNYPNGTATDFKVTLLNSSSLTLSSILPYYYYSNGQLIPTNATINTSLQKLTAADVSGNLVKVLVKADSIFSVKVYLITGGKTVLMDSINNTTKTYISTFTAQANDHLKVDVLGDFVGTYINAYADGLPINGDVLNTSSQETITTDGWVVQFPKK